jgi:hypothetical protein
MPAAKFGGERGFSLLIKEAGSYTLKGRVLGTGRNSCLSIKAEYSAAGDNTRRGKQGFSAELPLVFRNFREGDCIFRGGHKRRFSAILGSSSRSRYAVIITAEDALGLAAFIGIRGKSSLTSGEKDLIVMCRDSAGDSDSETLFFELDFGGMDV